MSFLSFIFRTNYLNILQTLLSALRFRSQGETPRQIADAGPCYTEQDIQYQVQSDGYDQSLNPDSEGKVILDTTEDCIEYCKERFGQTAQFFTWRPSGACRCKQANAGRQKKEGAISGNLWCDGMSLNSNIDSKFLAFEMQRSILTLAFQMSPLI